MRKRINPNSIKTKITLPIVILLLLATLVPSLLIYFYNYSYIQERQSLEILEANHKDADKINHIFQFITRLNENISNNEELIEEVTAKEPTIDTINLFLDNFHIQGTHLAIFALDINGNTVGSTDRRFVGNNYSFRPYFQNAINGTQDIYTAVGTTSNELGYYASIPIHNGDQIIGVLVAKIDPAYIEDSLSDSHLHQSGDMQSVTSIVDKYGVVIVSQDDDRTLTALDNFTEREQQEIQLHRNYPEIYNFDTIYAPIKESLNTTVEFSVKEIKNNEGETIFTSIHRIEGTDLFILSETNITDILQETNEFSIYVVIGIGLLVMVLIVGIYAFIYQLLRPLEKLTEYADQIREGKKPSQPIIKTKDEISTLATAFNKLLTQLSREREEVETKVQERTQDLEKINKALIGRELKMVELKEEITELKKKKNDKTTKK